MKSLWIITRDLRLEDNMVLESAISESETVLPIFIFNLEQIHSGGSNSLHFLYESLQVLHQRCQSYGSAIYFCTLQQFPKFLQKYGFTQAFINKAINPFEKERYHLYSSLLKVTEVDDALGWPREELLSKDGKAYVIRKWIRERLFSLGATYHPFISGEKLFHFHSDVVPEQWKKGLLPKSPEARWKGGEESGQEIISLITQRGGNLSPHLKFGTISPRLVFLVAQERGIEEIIDGLAARIQMYTLHDENRLQLSYSTIIWDNKHLEAWKNARTGYDIIDAGINQLREAGIMDNAIRMVVANFLVFGLKCNWQEGEQFFRQYLVDYDWSLNTGNWLWCAQLGIDRPRPNKSFDDYPIRIFIPETYAKKHREYIRKWLRRQAIPKIINEDQMRLNMEEMTRQYF
jgi:deoxyribodipyrimidine photo-lyase